MIIQKQILLNPGLFLEIMNTAPQCERPVIEIDGYPDYATTVDKLPEKSQAKIKEFAARIVESHKGSIKIRSFMVHGHADTALREPSEKRAQVEKEKSEQRAAAANNVLFEEIRKLPGGHAVADSMPLITSKGFGSRFRIAVPRPGHSLTEAEMRKNRRVEIFAAECPDPPPLPLPPPAPPSRPEIGVNWSIQIIGGISITTVLPPPATDLSIVNLTIFFEISDLDRKLIAKFRSNTNGTALVSISLLSAPVAIQSESFTVGDPTVFRTTKGVTLAHFVGSVEIMQNPGASFSRMSTGGNFNFDFTGLTANSVNTFTRPKLISASNGSVFLTMPKAGLGAATKGSLVQTGEPKAF